MSVQDSTIGVVIPKFETATTYGNIVLRAISFLLDELVLVPFFAIGYVMIAQGTTGWITGGVSIIAYGQAIGFYNRCILMGVTGQSWGKMVTGTRLVSVRTGEPLGVGKVIVRDMCHTVDFVLVIGSFFPLFDAKRQSLADKIAGSVVVNVRREAGQAKSALPH